MHADPAVHVGGAGLGAAEDVEVWQTGQGLDGLGGSIDPRGWSLSDGLPPARVLHAFFVVGSRLLREQKWWT